MFRIHPKCVKLFAFNYLCDLSWILWLVTSDNTCNTCFSSTTWLLSRAASQNWLTTVLIMFCSSKMYRLQLIKCRISAFIVIYGSKWRVFGFLDWWFDKRRNLKIMISTVLCWALTLLMHLTVLEDRKVAGSAKCKQSQTVWKCVVL